MQPVDRSEKQHAPSRRFFVASLAAVLLTAGTAVLLNSPFFRLERVQVTGNRRVTVSRLLEVAQVAEGDLRWRQPADAVAARVRLEAWVRTANVAWRPGELIIEITEREPVALLPYHAAFLLLDETGAVLEQVGSLTEVRLPVITGVQVDRVLRGGQVRHGGLLDSLYLLSWMAEPLRGAIGEVHVDEHRNLTFYMQGVAVLWGRLPAGTEREQRTREKLEEFGGIWARAKAGAQPVCQIDFRDARQAYVGCPEKPTTGSGN
jgi:cell division protein FtsQ